MSTLQRYKLHAFENCPSPFIFSHFHLKFPKITSTWVKLRWILTHARQIHRDLTHADIQRELTHTDIQRELTHTDPSVS